MMHRTPLRAGLALTVTLLLAAGDLAGAEGEFAALVAERQAGFEDMGAAAKVFRDQLRGDAPFDSLTQVEAAVMVGQQPGWWKSVFKLFLDYALDIPWRLKSKFHRRLATGCAGVARLRASMQAAWT